MRKLKSNEKIIKKYGAWVLIEVACPDGKSYKTAEWKYDLKDQAKVEAEGKSKSTYEYLGIRRK